MKRVLFFFLALVAAFPQFALAQERKITAVKCLHKPRIDGFLDDACWRDAPKIDRFVQREPEDGAPSHERSEVQVLYTEEEIFVGVTLYDSDPRGPKTLLGRKDNSLLCDNVTIWFDSLEDKRSAFSFTLNPSGVKKDSYYYDNTKKDSSWEAVWDGASRRFTGGWSAEFRIPLHQLRYPSRKLYSWGFQVERFITRTRETSYWAPVPKGSSQFVSLFGTLEIPQSLPSPRKVELLPYFLGKSTLDRENREDPYSRYPKRDADVGIDVKYGLTSNLTLNLAMNPDFGQVESDPAFINLSAFEVYLPEKRPFFIEGASLYKFRMNASGGGGDMEGGGSDVGSDTLFYSRRIGRAPQGYPRNARYADIPETIPITAALKVSGKTKGGWSLGFLEAVTPSMDASYIEDFQGSEKSAQIEPLTSYTVLRVQKDFRAGRSALGGIFTMVERNLDEESSNFLSDNAMAGGIDFRHRWGRDRYEVTGSWVMSRIEGSPEAILTAQESSARYFQRPDNTYSDYDPTRRSLSGYGFHMSAGKIGGEGWLWSVGTSGKSPGLELNDLGFVPESDSWETFASLGYNRYKPKGVIRNLRLETELWDARNFKPERIGYGLSGNAFLLFMNYWSLQTSLERNAHSLSPSALRGGPSLWVAGSWEGSAGFSTDYRKRVFMDLNAEYEKGDEGLSSTSISGSITWRVRQNLSLEFGPELSLEKDPLQYIDTFKEGLSSPRYLFGKIDHKTLGLTVRGDLALSPTLTLQLYAQPFVSSGEFSQFREVLSSRAEKESQRWHKFSPSESLLSDGVYSLTRPGENLPLVVKNPDFNFRQFKLNLVLRWEFRPGSALFLVWNQGRGDYAHQGRFRYFQDLSDLFGTHPRDVFLIKISYLFDL